MLDRFFFAGGRLPNDDGVARYIEVLVRLENRKGVEVLRVTGHQCRVLSNSTIDRQRLEEVMRLAGEAAFGAILSASAPQPGVVDAGHRFAKRRLDHVSRWKPSQAELALLSILVNRKAGRRIM